MMDEETCVVCKERFATERECKHRKHLFGKSCRDEFLCLDTLIWSQWVGLSAEHCLQRKKSISLCKVPTRFPKL